jgi:hypothetical protein
LNDFNCDNFKREIGLTSDEDEGFEISRHVECKVEKKAVREMRGGGREKRDREKSETGSGVEMKFSLKLR